MRNIQAIKQRFGIIGRSPLLDRALSTAIRVANTDLTILINGESGVGKEVFSKVIHSLSARKHNSFIAINCGAIPEGTINSELFGHEKGSFTGATSERKGYFEAVDGGTIFLDEIAELPLETQSYLLRVLESGEFLRVGSSKVHKTNVRIITATNVDLEKSVQSGKFREDLFYRISTVPINIPALRERREDINILFRKFASDFADKYKTSTIRLDEKAQILLNNYNWPGNIRELKNIAEQVSVLSEEKNITAEILIDTIPNLLNRNLPAIRKGGANTNDFQEREILYKLLFEMKHDLNDLKSLVFELINNNDLTVPNVKSLRQLNPARFTKKEDNDQLDFENYYPETLKQKQTDTSESLSSRPIIIENSQHSNYDKMEVVEENLSLEDMEKDFIQKSLKKHNNRRKEAAKELGISERTLYRKIKYYGL